MTTRSFERLVLRPWQLDDKTLLSTIANNKRIWRNMTNRFPYQYEENDALEWIEFSNTQPQDQRHFAIVVDDVVVGGAGFTRMTDLLTRTAEIGYWLGESCWGRGIATAALTKATASAFHDFDFVRLQAGVLDWNPGSCRVLEKAGYTLEARLKKQIYKDDAVCDQLIYALLREEHSARN